MMAQNMIVFQPEYGVSGDMILSSLIDLLRIDISPDSKFLKILNDIASGYESSAVVTPQKMKREEVQGLIMELQWDNSPEWSKSVKGAQLREQIGKACDSLNMNIGKDLALNTIDTIIEAEAKVHDQSPSEVKFFELSSPRMTINLIGVGYIVENYIDTSWQFCSTPIALGMGKVKIVHGEFKIPPPVTSEILTKFELKSNVHYHKGPYSGELATPSGIALMVNLVKHYFPASPIAPDKFGIGFGSKQFQSKQPYLRVLQS
ncbi:MAG: DUF111 family protein [Thermoplasmata archaeon]|nr:MAG: DUF111 family protein [Thermoplasmata archaeon]